MEVITVSRGFFDSNFVSFNALLLDVKGKCQKAVYTREHEHRKRSNFWGCKRSANCLPVFPIVLSENLPE